MVKRVSIRSVVIDLIFGMPVNPRTSRQPVNTVPQCGLACLSMTPVARRMDQGLTADMYYTGRRC